MLVAIAWLVRSHHDTLRVQGDWPVTVAETRVFLPGAHRLRVDPGPRAGLEVLDAAGQRIGYAVRTMPGSRKITGYSGPSDVLVVLDAEDRVLGVAIRHSYDTPSHEVPAGEIVRWDLTWTQVEPGFTARTTGDGPMWEFLGALDPGAYLGIVSVPTSEGELRMSLPITVTEPRCEVLTDELVERYVGLTGEEATAQANEDGFTYRVASIDGQALALADDLRCDRLNVDLVGGTVAQVGIY